MHPMPQLPDVRPRDLADPAFCEISLENSTARRARAARKRSFVNRSRGAGLATAATLALGASGAYAATGGATAGSSASPSSTSASGSTLKAVQSALGIPADGVSGPKTRKAIKSFQRKNGLTADGVVGPQTLAALGVKAKAAKKATTPAAPPASSDATTALAAIAECESGGDPTAVSSSGQYRGKYQFDRETWAANGGSGDDPAAAPEAEQDAIAAKLYAAQGTTPWPVCGKQVS